MGGGIVSSVTYSIFLLIMVFLVVTNYKGMTAVMKQGGTSTVSLVKALQGR